MVRERGPARQPREAPAKKLYPVITPLRNSIPRVKGAGGNATNWKAITDINVSKFQMGVMEGRRGAVIDTKVKDYTAAYKGLGLEDAMTFEAEYSTEGFDDLRARATEGLLRSVMIGEEQIILGGNGSKTLAQPGTITTAASASTGATITGTIKVQVIPLTQDGYYRSSVAGGIAQAQTHTAQDGQAYSVGSGSGVKAASEGSQATGGAGNKVTASIDPIEGAVAYAWFWGADATTNCKLGAITTVSRVEITANAAGDQHLGTGTNSVVASDHSSNSLVYDGILTQIWDNSGSSYRKALSGTAGLTVANGAVDEIDEALKSFWDNYKLSPDTIYVSAQELKNISNKLMNVTSSNLMFNASASGGDREFVAGGMVASYINKFSMTGAQAIPLRLHPNLAPGTLLFTRTVANIKALFGPSPLYP